MQEIIILAGPNGAGKTTFANEYLPATEEGLAYVNADEIAREPAVSALPQTQRDFHAGRLMLEQIDRLTSDRAEFMFETTLATLTYARKIPIWKSLGYSVALLYLRLPDVEHSIMRVRRRVEAGGHGIPENVIRRRYEKSLSTCKRSTNPRWTSGIFGIAWKQNSFWPNHGIRHETESRFGKGRSCAQTSRSNRHSRKPGIPIRALHFEIVAGTFQNATWWR